MLSVNYSDLELVLLIMICEIKWLIAETVRKKQSAFVEHGMAQP